MDAQPGLPRAQALEASKSAKLGRTYFDWNDWLKNHPNTPYTPSIPLLYGLKESLRLLRSEGYENYVARHARHVHRAPTQRAWSRRDSAWQMGHRGQSRPPAEWVGTTFISQHELLHSHTPSVQKTPIHAHAVTGGTPPTPYLPREA